VQTLPLRLLNLEVRPVDNSSWQSIRIIEYDCKAEEELKISTLDALIVWGNIGKDSRSRYTLRPRKGIEILLNSFSTLALTL